ncbi:hypothetical protein JCM10908_004679 [Rhodotorula pacifica]|uniref:uncharacterized protein n=1 Tax=Rhodotorula pacifica TaxID=1495444 RepID=UPI00317463F2
MDSEPALGRRRERSHHGSSRAGSDEPRASNSASAMSAGRRGSSHKRDRDYDSGNNTSNDDRYASPVASTSKATLATTTRAFDTPPLPRRPTARRSASPPSTTFSAATSARRPAADQGWSNRSVSGGPRSQFSPTKDRDRDRWGSDPRRERDRSREWSVGPVRPSSIGGQDSLGSDARERDRDRDRDSARRPPPAQRSWEPPVPRGNGWAGSPATFSSRERSDRPSTEASTPFQIPYLAKGRGTKRRRNSQQQDEAADEDLDDFAAGMRAQLRRDGPSDRWATDRERSRSAGGGGGGSRRNSPEAADRRREDDRWGDRGNGSVAARDARAFADSGTNAYSSYRFSRDTAPSEPPQRPPTLLERISRQPVRPPAARGRSASPPPSSVSAQPYPGFNYRSASDPKYSPFPRPASQVSSPPLSRSQPLRNGGGDTELAGATTTTTATSRSETPPLPPTRVVPSGTSASASPPSDDEMEEGELQEEGEIDESVPETGRAADAPKEEERPDSHKGATPPLPSQPYPDVLFEAVATTAEREATPPARSPPRSLTPLAATAAPMKAAELPPTASAPPLESHETIRPPASTSTERANGAVEEEPAAKSSTPAPEATPDQSGSSMAPTKSVEVTTQDSSATQQVEVERAGRSPEPVEGTEVVSETVAVVLAESASTEDTAMHVDVLASVDASPMPAGAAPPAPPEQPASTGEPPPTSSDEPSISKTSPAPTSAEALPSAVTEQAPATTAAASTAPSTTSPGPAASDRTSDVSMLDVSASQSESAPVETATITKASAASTDEMPATAEADSAIKPSSEIKEDHSPLEEADPPAGVTEAAQSAEALRALAPRPTDELSRHSPTTPPQTSVEHEHDDVPEASEVGKDASGDAAKAVDPPRKLTMEEERAKLVGGRVIQPFAERSELINTSWEAFEERHARLSTTLLETFSERDERRKKRIIQLRQEYKAFHGDWKAHCKRLDEIRDRVHRRATAGNTQATAPQTPSIDSSGMPFYPEPVTPGPSLTGGRSNRRGTGASVGTFGYSDTVRSEAEFLEILASLETADLRDPDVRAARTAAVVPDMVIDEAERRELLDITLEDERYRVDDPIATFDIDAPLDVWTEQEVETFCKRYALYPKQFGKIAQDLQGKTTAQCVLFYYRMKNTIDFRSLSDRRGRDGRRKKSKKRPEGGKGSSLLSNLNKKAKPALAPPREDEMEEDDEDEPSVPASPRGDSRAEDTADKMQVEEGPHMSRQAPAAVPAVDRPTAEESLPNGTATRRIKLVNGTPRLPADELPSEGMLEAAEVLGALSGFPAGAADCEDTMSQDHPGQDMSNGGLHGRSGAGRARKARVDIDTLPTEEALAASPYAAAPDVDVYASPHDRNKPKRKATTSSYWTLAERSEYQRLLSVYGPDWRKIAAGLGNKTWVQCRNWYQNQAKKNNLVDIVNSSDLDGGLRADGLEHSENPAMHTFARAGFFEAPASTTLSALPTAPVQAVDAGKAGMHLRDMLNDEARAPEREAPARDDWFGAESAETGSATTEDEVLPQRRSFSGGNESRFEIPRPSSAPQFAETVPRTVGGVIPYRPSPMVSSLSAFSSTPASGRLDGISRLPPMRSEPWPRSSVSAFPAYAVSPVGSGSPATPIAGVDPYRRYSGASSSADYFGVKPYERYAHSAEPALRAGSIPPLPPFSTLSAHSSPRLSQSFGAAPSPPNGLVRPPSHWTPQS